MLGKGLVPMLCRAVLPAARAGGGSAGGVKPALFVPKRTWAQVGLVISTPPRNPVSSGEKIAHAIVMYVVWLAPTFWFMSQLKVWRRRYVEE